MQDNSIAQIIELLETITVQNDRITEEIGDLRQDITNITTQLNRIESNQAAVVTRKGKASSPKARKDVKPPAFKKGDRVIILNPKRGQDDKGVIIGFTIIGHPQIRTASETTRRAPHNLDLDPDYH